jgi:GNAT superfamily N-acetyltransferase
VLIRPAHPEESALLSDLALRSKGHWGYDAAFLESCREELTLTEELITDERAHVAEKDGQVVGFYTLAGRPPEGQLGHMFVEPAHVNQKIGRRLWEHAIGTAEEEGIRRILIEADPYAEAFYEAMGAIRVGEIPSGSIPGRVLPLLAYYLSYQ